MEKQNSYKKFIAISLATIFGVGFFPVAPGTFGSLAAVGLFYLIEDKFIFLLITIFFLSVSFPVSSKAATIFKEKDPKQIVIDEFVGQALILCFIPKETTFILLAFILFRLFDIFKIYPANLAEKKPGAKGIILDDLVATGYSLLLIQSLRFILYIS